MKSISILASASLLVIAAVGLRRLTLAANKLWTKRYIQSTIPSP